MQKRLINNEEELQQWGTSEGSGMTHFAKNQIMMMFHPTRGGGNFPVVLIWDWSSDEQSRDWLQYEYVFLKDFNNE
jgi:hypothetical protein